MGFSTFATNLRTELLGDALNWTNDFLPIIALVFGLVTFGVALTIIRKFI